MGAPEAKLTITVPSALVAAMRRRAGCIQIVARAIANGLDREQLTTYLDELGRAFGPVPREALVDARRAWGKL